MLKNNSNLFVLLWSKYLSKNIVLIILVGICSLIYAGSMGLIALSLERLQKGLISLSGSGDQFNSLIIIGIILFMFSLITSAAQYLQVKISNLVSLRVIRDLQSNIFAKLLTLDEKQVHNVGIGQITARFTSDMVVLRESLIKLTLIQRDIFTLIILVSVLIYFDYILFLIIVGIYAFAAIPFHHLTKILRNTSKKVQNQMGSITSFVIEAINGRRLISVYRLEKIQNKKAKSFFQERYILSSRMIHFKALTEPVVFLLGALSIVIILFVAIYRIYIEALSAEKFISFLLTFTLLSQSTKSLATLNAILQEGLAAFARCLEFNQITPTIKDQNERLSHVTYLKIIDPPKIEFNNVDFSYTTGTKVIDKLSFVIPAKQMIAIVGPSGSGKSTLLSLLLRMYDFNEGSIKINGFEITDYNLSTLRGSISYVGQEATIFKGTIYENILLGNLQASYDQVVEAAKQSFCQEFIDNMPNGFNSLIEPNGQNLSGGQKQRIAIARAFLKNSPILLLDEITSALDAKSERAIVEAIANLRQGKTTIVIAHRLSTIMNANNIIVLNKGKVIEIGTHTELIANFGLYADLASKQNIYRDKL